MSNDYLERILKARVYDVAIETPLEHAPRLSRRLGLTEHSDPTKIEQDLIELLPTSEWVDFAHRMIHHGRAICVARKPRCPKCSMVGFCPKVGVTAVAED